MGMGIAGVVHDKGMVCMSASPKSIICIDYPPLQPFPLQEAREVHGLLVGGKWNPTQIITNYSVGRDAERGLIITS